MSGAEVLALIGLGLAAPGVIDVLVRVGQGITSKISKDKKAKDYASYLQVFVLPSGIDRLRLHMRGAQSLLRDPTVNEVDKNRLNSIFDALKSTLKLMDDLANIILAPGDTFGRKRRPAIEALRNEAARFKELLDDFRERIIALRALTASDSDVFLTEHEFQWIFSKAPPEMLNPSTFIRNGRVSRDIKNVEKNEVRRFLYESRPYTAKNKNIMQAKMRTLCQKLDAAEKNDPGILPILGFRDDTDEEEFQMLFIIPNIEQNAQTLMSAIQALKVMPSLNVRIDICFQLAEAILHVHSAHLVHKCIRPDNIVMLGSLDGGESMTTDIDEKLKLKVFLLGWQFARSATDVVTDRKGEELWQRRVYQHPQRQQEEAEADYNMGHDIYSFGACMLEILRWKALVTQSRSEFETTKSELSSDFTQMFESLNLRNEHAMRTPNMSDIDWIMREPRNVQKVLLSLNNNDLPRLVGNRLTTLVSDCLTRLDTMSGGAEDVSFDTDNRRDVGNDFVDRVLKPIRDLLRTL
jgi:hypothetical protein